MTNDIFSFNTSNFDKFFVGADQMVKNFAKAHEMASKAIPGYPPYNIVKVDDNKYCIEMAVAGFGKQNIDIEVANSTLTITGGIKSVEELDEEDKNPISYLYKGIADRTFTRKFTLADTVEVKNAELINGMLKLWLENIIPDEKKPKKVEIS
jgi:molecular chaperone IbpA